MKKLRYLVFLFIVLIIPVMVSAASNSVCTPAKKQKYDGYGFIATSKKNQYLEGVEYICDLGNGKNKRFYTLDSSTDDIYLIAASSISYSTGEKANEELAAKTKDWTNFDAVLSPGIDLTDNREKPMGAFVSFVTVGSNGSIYVYGSADGNPRFNSYYNKLLSNANEKGIDISNSQKNFLLSNVENWSNYYNEKNGVYYPKKTIKNKEHELGYFMNARSSSKRHTYMIINKSGTPETAYTSWDSKTLIAKIRPVVRLKKKKLAVIKNQSSSSGSSSSGSGSSTTPVTPTTYTVTFNTNGGNNIASQTITSGGKVTQPANPTKEGYIFAGWYSDSNLTTAYNFNTSVTGNITLHAKWNTTSAIQAFSVVFNTNGGSEVAAQNVKGGSIAVRPADPTKEGYIFAGWYSDSGLTTEYNFNTPVTGIVTLYAKWTVEEVEEEPEDADSAWSRINGLIEFIDAIEVPEEFASLKDAVQGYIDSILVTDEEGNVVGLNYKVFQSTDGKFFAAAPAGSLDEKTIVETKEIVKTDEEYKKINNAINDKLNKKVKNITIYDIQLKLNNQNVQPKSDMYMITKLPEGYNENKVVVYRQESDGSYKRLEHMVILGYIGFKTDHFSKYAIVEYEYDGTIEELEAEGRANINNPKTGSNISKNSILVLIGMSITAIGIYYFVKRKQLIVKL